MGQYYYPVLLDAEGKVTHTANSHEYGNGLKLMEHSWMQNQFVAVIEAQLTLDGPRRVVWAGDYADPEEVTRINDEGEEYTPNLNTLAHEDRVSLIRWNVTGWTGGYRTPKPEPVDPLVKLPTMSSHPWLLNWDKMEAVDKRKVLKDSDGWRIHPLPLLTVEGNGEGGGDYFGKDDHKLVGSWARDRISSSRVLPKGFSKIVFDLVER